jgi:hypothetical protein
MKRVSKEYKSPSDKDENIINEPAAIYKSVRSKPAAGNIPYNENGIPKGYALDEVFDEIDLEWSETSGIDFCKLNRLVHSNKLNLDDLTDETLHSPEFKYEPYPGFKPKSCEKPDFSPEWLAAMDNIFK